MLNYQNTNNHTENEEFSLEERTAPNKFLTALSYLSILFLVPLIAEPNSKYVRFHVNQGLVLFLIGAAYEIICRMLLGIVKLIFVSFLSPFYYVVWAVTKLLSLVFFAFAVIGIVNALRCEAKELPIIGKIKLLK